MSIQQYLGNVSKRLHSGIAGEHSYRGDLEALIRSLAPGVDLTNEPLKITNCGNPDFVITRQEIPIGFIEAKDIGKDLEGKQYKEQFDRYRKALDNLIITDYLKFLFYQNGVRVAEIEIAKVIDGGKFIWADDQVINEFSARINDFCSFTSQSIKSPKKLAGMMAGKARLLQIILEKAVTSDEETQENSTIQDQFRSFKKVLIHDLTPKAFADIYAQTLAYGMFAARLHDKSLNTFSRQEAAVLIPKTNPFLRKLFQYVAGYDVDERIVTTVDNLAEVFRATDVEALLSGFGISTRKQDPLIHFYETFLAEYDSGLRKDRGVWYTPEPVVNFMVRAVDGILKNSFALTDGLADTSKIKIKSKTDKVDRRTKSGYVELDREVHRVQVLDPATGTGTFLAEVIKHIYNKKFKAVQGAWSGYVEEHLIPRINGFELLMASYSMAHLKLEMLLKESGYTAKKDKRLNIFLTNTLEEHHPDTGTLFASWLSAEASEANNTKRDSPIMLVIGNPPYAVTSSNKGAWIKDLIADYKLGLNEKKINLDDDYIKFIRYGQHLIEKNGEGILAYITNNSFINGVTHRRMRESLLKTFNTIYIFDLHGNSQKKEKSLDGSRDENVFSITQGVSINFFIKTRSKEKPGLFHSEIYGSRNEKFSTLLKKNLMDISWATLQPSEPYFFFTPQDHSSKDEYESGFSIQELFNDSISGLETGNDAAIAPTSNIQLKEFISHINSQDISILKSSYGYSQERASQVISDFRESEVIDIKLAYRPFDTRASIYTKNSQGVLWRPRNTTLFGMTKDNLCLAMGRQTKNQMISHYFVSKEIIEKKYAEASTQCYCMPLYVYPDGLSELSERIVNFNMSLVHQISEKLALGYFESKESGNGFSEIDLFDYCYAILYSPSYRLKHDTFLRIDFPRIPYPTNVELFNALAKLGSELRKLHLLESTSVDDPISSYPQDGDNSITRKIVQKDWELYDPVKNVGRVRINETQYFDQIPEKVWNFYIGGYQPVQRWLKDRYGMKLTYDEIIHYQKIISALSETIKIMTEIDLVLEA